jgi:hypothetical protein
MPSVEETKTAIDGSLREWGINPKEGSPHLNFSNKIRSVAVDTAVQPSIGEIDFEQDKIPKDQDCAIKFVYLAGLQEFRDDEIYKLRLEEIEDALEQVLTTRDEANRIVGLPPYYQVESTRYCAVKRKPAFSRFRASDLDPFHRFSASRQNLSKSELAFKECSAEG